MLKLKDWLLEGCHPETEAEAMEMLGAGKLLVCKQFIAVPCENIERDLWVANCDNSDIAPAYFIQRFNKWGQSRPEASMMFRSFHNGAQWNFIDTLTLIGPIEQWITAVRKESP